MTEAIIFSENVPFLGLRFMRHRLCTVLTALTISLSEKMANFQQRHFGTIV